MLLRASLCVTTLTLLASATSAVLAACSSTDAPPTLSPAGATCAVYTPPTTFDPTTPTVSFKTDVMGVITQSCAFSSCHGSLGGPTGGLYMGENLSKTYLDLVGVASQVQPSMARVKAGDPANSFLQHKIDGDACTLSGCTSDSCQESMPQAQDLLAVNDRLTFRAWIAQGAVADFPLVIPDAGADASDSGASDAGAGGSDASTDASGE